MPRGPSRAPHDAGARCRGSNGHSLIAPPNDAGARRSSARRRGAAHGRAGLRSSGGPQRPRTASSSGEGGGGRSACPRACARAQPRRRAFVTSSASLINRRQALADVTVTARAIDPGRVREDDLEIPAGPRRADERRHAGRSADHPRGPESRRHPVPLGRGGEHRGIRVRRLSSFGTGGSLPPNRGPHLATFLTDVDGDE